MPKKAKEPISNWFKENNYIVVTDVLPKELVSFVYAYFQNKRNVARYLFDKREISPYEENWGTWADKQIPDTYSHYSDIAMETIMLRILPVMKQVTGIDLLPAYTYARIYKYGDVLHRHKDRESCEVSCTINLGGDMWPISLDPTGGKGNEGKAINLKPGDMLVYKGYKLEHWRAPFEGHECGQVFCHYVDSQGSFAKEHFLDGRPMIGLSANYRGKPK